VLAAFYALHLFGVGLAAGLPSRQASLAQVPVALLLAWGLAALASRLERLLASPDGARVVRQLPLLAALLLVICAVQDHRLAARLTHQAGDTTRALSREVAAAVRPGDPRAVVLVNAPLLLFERGIGTPVLRDGAGQIPRSASPAVTRVELRHVPLPRTLPHLTDAVPMTQAELRARVVDPGRGGARVRAAAPPRAPAAARQRRAGDRRALTRQRHRQALAPGYERLQHARVQRDSLRELPRAPGQRRLARQAHRRARIARLRRAACVRPGTWPGGRSPPSRRTQPGRAPAPARSRPSPRAGRRGRGRRGRP
jgi:hypothetical protein